MVFSKKIQQKPCSIFDWLIQRMGTQPNDISPAFRVPNAMCKDTAIFFSHTKKATFAVCIFQQMRGFHANISRSPQINSLAKSRLQHC